MTKTVPPVGQRNNGGGCLVYCSNGMGPFDLRTVKYAQAILCSLSTINGVSPRKYVASGPKSARTPLRRVVERHWRQADVVKGACRVKRDRFCRALDGHIPKTQNPPSRNAFAGGSDCNGSRRGRSLWLAQWLPW